MISERLKAGKKNATTMKQLVDEIGCDRRMISAWIQHERDSGCPICGCTTGYYIASSADELEEFCRRIHRRAITELKTLDALKKTLRRMKGDDTEQITFEDLDDVFFIPIS